MDAVTDEAGNEISGTGEGHGPARYLTKIGGGWGLCAEIAGGNMKRAKGSSMNPAQLVSTWVASKLAGQPDDRLAAVIRELHKATKGRHMTHISAQLRKWVAARTSDVDETEQADDEIANEEVGGGALAAIEAEVYTWIKRLDAVPDLLDGAEDNGIDGAVEALRDRGLPVMVAVRSGGGDGVAQPPLITFGPGWLRGTRGKRRCLERERERGRNRRE